ncbi:hypothetical protein FRB95_005381 [Tulasnella sp. JGI-2019a]|nr:hypothetical protein FRB95_005381 [Tulasnella sp. JGI-2019a]
MDPTIIDPKRKWSGFDNLKYIFVFGDSYSSVGFPPSCPEPTEDQPLGVEWPGQTWSDDKPVWIGHLINSYVKDPVLVYDYAVGGSFYSDIGVQVKKYFMEGAGNAECDGWQPDDSLFVTWVGVNDVGCDSETKVPLEALFSFQDELYHAGARNFLFLNVPPLPRAASSEGSITRERLRRSQACLDWNALLAQKINHFAPSHSHPQASAFLFDVHDLFTRILRNPPSFGFSSGKDVGTGFDDEVWVDGIHPSTQTQKIIAREVASFMTGKEVEEREPRYKSPLERLKENEEAETVD